MPWFSVEEHDHKLEEVKRKYKDIVDRMYQFANKVLTVTETLRQRETIEQMESKMEVPVIVSELRDAQVKILRNNRSKKLEVEVDLRREVLPRTRRYSGSLYCVRLKWIWSEVHVRFSFVACSPSLKCTADKNFFALHRLFHAEID